MIGTALARSNLLLPASLLALALAAGCGEDGPLRRGAPSADSADGDINLPSYPMRQQAPYQVVAVSQFGSVSGSVSLPAGSDSIVAGPCPSEGEAPPATFAEPTPVVVWLDDIRRGRALAEMRRYELVAGRCSFDPVVQVAIAGGTLNVRNFDRIEHDITFHRTGFRNALLDVPFVLNGQIVPSTTLLVQPGVVEARTTQDTTLRAFIFVIDHPYATVVRDGRFSVDSIPAGRYTVRAWSPAGLAEAAVEVRAGSDARVDLAPRH